LKPAEITKNAKMTGQSAPELAGHDSVSDAQKGGAYMIFNRPDPTKIRGSDPDGQLRRTDGSTNDPHGGLEAIPRNRPDADPIEELATIDSDSHDNNPDRPHLANQPGSKPGFGPNPNAEKLVGNPELGIDPREAAGSWQNGPKEP
jgi:hypothetical protein